jgi:hypothetical protein
VPDFANPNLLPVAILSFTTKLTGSADWLIYLAITETILEISFWMFPVMS